MDPLKTKPSLVDIVRRVLSVVQKIAYNLPFQHHRNLSIRHGVIIAGKNKAIFCRQPTPILTSFRG